jgi:hypothetical protein
LPGFVNIDANPRQKIDLWLDLRCGLPLANSSLGWIYSTPMLEHLNPDDEKIFFEAIREL